MIELFDRLCLPRTALVNSEMYEAAPEVVAAFRARGGEIPGHGRTNAEMQGVLAEADEARLIAETTGPCGWIPAPGAS